jgi:hypothetical protein
MLFLGKLSLYSGKLSSSIMIVAHYMHACVALSSGNAYNSCAVRVIKKTLTDWVMVLCGAAGNASPGKPGSAFPGLQSCK